MGSRCRNRWKCYKIRSKEKIGCMRKIREVWGKKLRNRVIKENTGKHSTVDQGGARSSNFAVSHNSFVFAEKIEINLWKVWIPRCQWHRGIWLWHFCKRFHRQNDKAEADRIPRCQWHRWMNKTDGRKSLDTVNYSRTIYLFILSKNVAMGTATSRAALSASRLQM
jgi:hypothetical protein